MCAVVAYGHILPPDVLAVPPRGTVNVHFSLLPAYRGAAPVQRAIMAGETETGVTTFLLEPTVDTGPMLLQIRERIDPGDSTGSLLERLASIGARALVDTLDGLEAGTLKPVEQDPALASPAPKIKPEEGAIDWKRPAAEIANLVRALDPASGGVLHVPRQADQALACPRDGRARIAGRTRHRCGCRERASRRCHRRRLA